MPIRITRIELVPGTGTGKAPKAVETARVLNRAGEEVEITTKYAATQGHYPTPHFEVEWDELDADGNVTGQGSWEVEAQYPRDQIIPAVRQMTGEEIISG